MDDEQLSNVEYLNKVLDFILDLQVKDSERQETFTPQTRLKTAVRRLAALAWLIKPELVGNMTTPELGAALGCDGSQIRHYAAWISEQMGIRTSQQWARRSEPGHSTIPKKKKKN